MSSGTSCSRLDGILSPKSIAVVGASTRPGTVGNDIFRNLLLLVVSMAPSIPSIPRPPT